MSFFARATGLISLVVASTAFAGTLPVTLIWQAPEPCPQYAAVWAQLTERLGRAPTTPEGSAFAARGVVDLVDAGWRLELQTLTGSGAGTRVLTHADCGELARRAVVVLALAIDPSLSPPPEVTPPAFWLGAGPQTMMGVLPLPSLGLVVSGRFEPRPFAFGLSVDAALPQTINLSSSRGLRVSTPIAGSVEGCLGVSGARFGLDGCAVVRVALMLGEAVGVEVPRGGAAPLVQAGARGEGRVVLTPLVALKLRLGVAFSVVKPAFVFADGEVGFAPGLVAGEGALLVDFRLW